MSCMSLRAYRALFCKQEPFDIPVFDVFGYSLIFYGLLDRNPIELRVKKIVAPCRTLINPSGV